MRFGLIGYGVWGKMHAAAMSKLDEVTLAGISCKSEATEMEARQDYPDVPVYRSYEDLLRRDDIDAVSIVLPNYLHGEVGVAALESGKDVLLEKPMASSAEECDRLIAAAERNGRVLSVAEQFRLSPQWKKVKEIVVSGDIGEPMSALITLFRHQFRFTSERWRYRPEMVTSWILEDAVHFFDQALWFLEGCGGPTSVLAYGNSKGREASMYDNFVSVIRFPGETYAVIVDHIGGFEFHIGIEIVGTEGALRAWRSGVRDRSPYPTVGLKVQRRGQAEAEVVPVEGNDREAYELLEEEFRQVVTAFGERRPVVSGRQGRRAAVLCLESDRSIREGREIELHL